MRIQANDFIFQIFNWPSRTTINKYLISILNTYRLTQRLTVDHLSLNIGPSHPLDVLEGPRSICEMLLEVPLLFFLLGGRCRLPMHCWTMLTESVSKLNEAEMVRGDTYLNATFDAGILRIKAEGTYLPACAHNDVRSEKIYE